LNREESLRIKSATKADAKTLAKLNATVHKIHTDLFPTVFKKATLGAFEKLFKEWLGMPGTEAFIAFDGAEPIGYMLLKIVRREPNALVKARTYLDIDQICVVNKRRRQGVAKRLLKEAKEMARREKIKEIQLNVWSQNTVAREAFKTLGFRTYNERMVLKKP